MLRKRVLAEMHTAEDNVRIYLLGEQWKGRVEHYGARPVFAPDAPLII